MDSAKEEENDLKTKIDTASTYDAFRRIAGVEWPEKIYTTAFPAAGMLFPTYRGPDLLLGFGDRNDGTH